MVRRWGSLLSLGSIMALGSLVACSRSHPPTPETGAGGGSGGDGDTRDTDAGVARSDPEDGGSGDTDSGVDCSDAGDGGTSSDHPVYQGQLSFEAQKYDVDLDLVSSRARSTVSLTTTSSGQCLTIGYRQSAVDSVALGGAPAAGVFVDVANHTLTACDQAGRGWPAATELTLSVSSVVSSTTVKDSDVGFSSRLDADGATFTYLLSWLGGCDRHGPCDAAPDRFATFKFTVHHSSSTQVLCPGEVTPGPDTTVCNFAFEGGPTYSTFAVLARQPEWTFSRVGTWGGVEVSLFDEPSSGIAAALKRNAAQLEAHFDWLQRVFGPYPYGGELRLVVAPTYWAGFEHPGNIALSETLRFGPSFFADGLTHSLMHEVVHQWAGDHATLKGTRDYAWKEAMAEYLTFVSEAERIGEATALRTARAWKLLASQARYSLVPEDEIELFDYYGDVYGAGPMLLFRQLEVMYGRDQVIAALVQLIGQPRPRMLSMDDVRAALEASTGADLSSYFAAWVSGRGEPKWPLISTDLRDAQGAPCTGGQCTLLVRATTADNVPRGAAFTVRILGAQPSEVLDVPVSNGPSGGPYPARQLSLSFSPSRVVIDPNSEALVFNDVIGAAARSPVPVEPWRRR